MKTNSKLKWPCTVIRTLFCISLLQSQFDELFNKFGIYSAGEQLFGLTVTEYPKLMKIKKELGLLQKLYGLYTNVMTVINGYFDILWTEVDIEKINSELSDMQNRYKLDFIFEFIFENVTFVFASLVETIAYSYHRHCLKNVSDTWKSNKW